MPEQPSPWRRYLRFSSMGIELGLSVMIGLIGGQWLDKRFGTEPWLLLLGLVFGMAAGFRSVFRALKHLTAADKTPPLKNPPPGGAPPDSRAPPPGSRP
jgi:F0F1-type ATP synthase assembly protein I